MKKNHLLFLLLLTSFLFATNRYLTLTSDKALLDYAGPDSYSYIAISQAFPHWPSKDLVIPFHHAQRFAIPYLIGGLAKSLELSVESIYRVTVIFLILGIILIFNNLLSKLEIRGKQKGVALLFLILNPYTFRPYIAIPFLLNDLAFELGLLILLFALFTDSVGLVLLSTVIGSLSRQTNLLLVPFVCLWICLFKTTWAFNKRVLFSLVIASLSLGIYLFEGHVALEFSGPNWNSKIAMGLFHWLRNSFVLRDLLEFLLRAVIAFVVPGLFLIALAYKNNFRSWPRDQKAKFLLLLLATLSICSQPLAGGPEITGASVTRLDFLGFLPFLTAIALGLKNFEISKDVIRRVYWAAWFVLIIGSFHHIFSIIKGSNSKYAAIFAVLQVLLGIILFVSTLVFRKLSKAKSFSPTPKEFIPN